MSTAFWRGVSEHDYNSLKEAVRAQARRFPSNDVLEARPTEVLHEAIVRLAESAGASPENPEHYAKLISMQCGWLRSNAWKRTYRWKDFCEAPAQPRPAAPNPAESAAGPDACCSLASLGPVPQGVVRLRLQGAPVEAVADAMGISTARASETQAWALQVMRRKLAGRDDQG